MTKEIRTPNHKETSVFRPSSFRLVIRASSLSSFVSTTKMSCYSIPSFRWICSNDTPLVSGMNFQTINSCRTIIDAKNKKA